MVKIQKLPSGQLVITIPKLLAEYEGLKKGMEMEFRKHKDGFILEIKKKSTKIKDFLDTKNSKNFLVKGG